METLASDVQPMVIAEDSGEGNQTSEVGGDTPSGGDNDRHLAAPPVTASISATSQDTTAPQGLDLGSVYKQCSVARSAASTMSVTEISNGLCVTAPANTPKIGTLDWAGDESVLKTFHGGRTTKNGRTVNECVSVSFDPRNFQCLGCESAHNIIHPLKPPVIILSDQNFVPFLPGGPENCVAVIRLENPSLNELVDIAVEMFEKTTIPAGAVLIIGSGSHLFKVGASQYAMEWIQITQRCAQKWPKVNICPLVPICRNTVPGSFGRDISILAAWLGRIYANSTTGLLETWKLLLQFAEAHGERASAPEICKIPLPVSTSAGSVQTHCFVFHSSSPAWLPGLDRKATSDLLRALIETLNRDFSTNLNGNIIVHNSWGGETLTTRTIQFRNR
jgi:hypothetical protein